MAILYEAQFIWKSLQRMQLILGKVAGKDCRELVTKVCNLVWKNKRKKSELSTITNTYCSVSYYSMNGPHITEGL
jgi:hypothetical protein